MEETRGSAFLLVTADEKQLWKCQLQNDFPEDIISNANIRNSYTQLTLPYSVVCQQRYARAKKLVRTQYLKELSTMELMQSTALDGIKVHRIFSEGFQLQKRHKMPSPFTSEEQRRLDRLLEDERTLK